MPIPRAHQVDLDVTTYYHCISRCVRRAFLCGRDRYSGKNFDHRKQWLVDRLRFLSNVFAVDVCAYAVMSNHFHLVVRVDRDRATAWSDREVIRRHSKIFGQRRHDLDTLSAKQRAERIALWRSRLHDLSWMMRALNEWIARKANREDGCKGRFWEGRFRSQALLDEGALLTCMSYVDLNPVRAGLSESLADSDLTSIQERLRVVARGSRKAPRKTRGAATPGAPENLMPFADQARTRQSETLPLAFVDYVELLQWAGGQVRPGWRGTLRQQPAVLARLGLNADSWLGGMQQFGRGYSYLAGDLDHLSRCHERLGRRWTKGVRLSQQMYRAA